MLLYSKRAPPKTPKRRSRAGCIHCKERKKKCNEQRPRCDRCLERNLECGYEPVKPRKRRRVSTAGLSQADSEFSEHQGEQWREHCEHDPDLSPVFQFGDGDGGWDEVSEYTYAVSEACTDVAIREPDAGRGNTEDGAQEIVRRNSLVRRDSVVRRDSLVRRHMMLQEPVTNTLIRTKSQYPSLSMIAPSSVVSPLLEFSAPQFMEFTESKNRRVLIDHFCNVLSHLIVLKEDDGNPFRKLLLPLSYSSSPVLNAIYALSSAHLEYRGVQNEEKSLGFHNKALQGLAVLIDQNNHANREEVLAAIILLVYYEVLVQPDSSNIVNGHLRGAMTVMQSRSTESSPTSRFLERAFAFYDVISALSFGTSPISTTPPALSRPSSSSSDASPLDTIDTLLGLSTSLWPIIQRLSTLPSAQKELTLATQSNNTRHATVLRTEFESTTTAIELALTSWSPRLSCPHYTHSRSPSVSEEARIQSILNNAEAYRQAALVYLYRYVKGMRRDAAMVQNHVGKGLVSCVRVVRWGGPMSALLWPLFVASVEAVGEEDRGRARCAFGGVGGRQGMVNIARAWRVVEEVWRRVDDGEVDVGWRKVAEELGMVVVFG